MDEKLAVETLVYGNDPQGLKTVKKSGSNLQAFIVPRADLKDLKSFQFVDNPAVYFLFGDLESDLPNVYIGQTDSFIRRMLQQDMAKDYWDVAVGFIAERNLDVIYLEKKCLEEAYRSERFKIRNNSKASGRKISDFIQASNDSYLKEIKFLLSLLGFNVFSTVNELTHKSELYFIKSQIMNINARGKVLEGNEFVVYKGSTARLKEAQSYKKNVPSGWNMKQRLVDEGILQKTEDGKNYLFTKDYIFKSPSGAGDTILGRSVNGWIEWKDSKGRTLDENIRQKNNINKLYDPVLQSQKIKKFV